MVQQEQPVTSIARPGRSSKATYRQMHCISLNIQDAGISRNGKHSSWLDSISKVVTPSAHRIVMIDYRGMQRHELEMRWNGIRTIFDYDSLALGWRCFTGCVMKKRLTGPPVNQLLPKLRDNISSLSASFPPTKLRIVKKTFSVSFLHFLLCPNPSAQSWENPNRQSLHEVILIKLA